MVVGDDFYNYSFEFWDGDSPVVVSMNRTFVMHVLGCVGDKAQQEACIAGRAEELRAEALARRSSWFKHHRGIFICTLGLTGIPTFDQSAAFPHITPSNTAAPST